MVVAKLTVPETGAVLRLDPKWKTKWRIGRDPSTCDIIVNGPTVSRRHFEVYYRQSQYHLRDLGSTNGTWEGETKVPKENSILLGSSTVLCTGMSVNKSKEKSDRLEGIVLFTLVREEDEDDDEIVVLCPGSVVSDDVIVVSDDDEVEIGDSNVDSRENESSDSELNSQAPINNNCNCDDCAVTNNDSCDEMDRQPPFVNQTLYVDEDIKPFGGKFSLTYDAATIAKEDWHEVLDCSQQVICISDDEEPSSKHDVVTDDVIRGSDYLVEMERFLDDDVDNLSDERNDEAGVSSSQTLRDFEYLEGELLTQPTRTAQNSLNCGPVEPQPPLIAPVLTNNCSTSFDVTQCCSVVLQQIEHNVEPPLQASSSPHEASLPKVQPPVVASTTHREASPPNVQPPIDAFCSPHEASPANVPPSIEAFGSAASPTNGQAFIDAFAYPLEAPPPKLPAPVTPSPQRSAIMLPSPLSSPASSRRRKRKDSSSRVSGSKRNKRLKTKENSDDDSNILTPRTKKKIRSQRKERLQQIALTSTSHTSEVAKKPAAPYKIKATQKSRNELLWGLGDTSPSRSGEVGVMLPPSVPSSSFRCNEHRLGLPDVSLISGTPVQSESNYNALPTPIMVAATASDVRGRNCGSHVSPLIDELNDVRPELVKINDHKLPRNAAKDCRRVNFNEALTGVRVYQIPEGNRLLPCSQAERSRLPALSPTEHYKKAISSIINWNAKWIHESLKHPSTVLPPLIKDLKIRGLRHVFHSAQSYARDFAPLLTSELWAKIVRHWKHYHPISNRFKVAVDKVTGPNSDRQLQVQCHALLPGDVIYTNDLVNMSKLDQSESTLGVVTIVTADPVIVPTQVHPDLRVLIDEKRSIVRMMITVKSQSYIKQNELMLLKAIYPLEKHLTTVTAIAHLETSPLSPVLLHPRAKMRLPPPAKQAILYSGTLDRKQKEAVLRLTAGCQGPSPILALVTGPAGSGKSKVLLALLIQLLRPPMFQTPQVVVCSSADSSLDQLLNRFRQHAQPGCNGIKAVKFKGPGTIDQAKDLYDADVIFCKVFDTGAKVLTETLNTSSRRVIILIEDAMQCVEADALVPLMLHPIHIILSGDVCALQSRVHSEVARKNGLARSLLWRIYSECHREPKKMDAVFHFTVQHRMHPAIADAARKLRYTSIKETLEDSATLQSARRGPLKPCVGLALPNDIVGTADVLVDAIAGVINVTAAMASYSTAVVLFNKKWKPSALMNQLSRLKKTPRKLLVDGVQQMQGREVDLVLLVLPCTPPSSEEILVALTRARFSAIFIFEKAYEACWEKLASALGTIFTLPYISPTSTATIRDIICLPHM